jgi:SPX domain protein involved in polyphosphate accumulation
MKFSEQFEYHKIPEWYSEYLDYKYFKDHLKHFRTKVSGTISIPINNL